MSRIKDHYDEQIRAAARDNSDVIDADYCYDQYLKTEVNMSKMTKEDLLAYGFKESENPLEPMSKQLSPELSLVITMERGNSEFALQTPDGNIFLKCDLRQLQTIESAIRGYSNFY
jgi:hypothetical protein